MICTRNPGELAARFEILPQTGMVMDVSAHAPGAQLFGADASEEAGVRLQRQMNWLGAASSAQGETKWLGEAGAARKMRRIGWARWEQRARRMNGLASGRAARKMR
jgi:hypothetical protein